MKKSFLTLLLVLLVGISISSFYIPTTEAVVTTDNYEIPKMYFEGNISEMLTKEDERKIKINYVSNDVNFHSYASIKIQGSSSLAYEKKNYTIKLYEDEKLENKKKIDVGFGKQYKYCLKANWIDKTHARNIVTARLTSEIQEKYGLFNNTPNHGLIDGFPIEVYINNEFLGIYTFNIPKDAWMFNMDESNPNHLVFVAENWSTYTVFKDEPIYGPWATEVGEESLENLDKFKRLSNFVLYSDDETFERDFRDYIDFNAAVNYLIMLEFAGLYDNVAKNSLFVTYDGEIWYPSLYDLDTSWGASAYGDEKIDYLNTEFHLNSKLWERFINTFSGEIANRYFELRKDILTKEHVMELFYDFKELIPNESFEKENSRWTKIPGYNYGQIEEFLDVRIPLIDEIMLERKNS